MTLKCKQCGKEMQRKDFKSHSTESCYLENFTTMSQSNFNNIAVLRQIAKSLMERINKLDTRISVTCCSCNKFSCEVSKKSCKNCKKIYCIPCVRKYIKNCKTCDFQTCAKCDPSDICSNC